jgi:hypothetical protein
VKWSYPELLGEHVESGVWQEKKERVAYSDENESSTFQRIILIRANDGMKHS